jgi:decaprenylphospho-beta-D-erythro-pentofuranosid-2-ulose 2-reductase
VRKEEGRVTQVRTVLVLGGTCEVGRACADAVLAEAPGTIVLAGADRPALESAATSLRQPQRAVDTVEYDTTAAAGLVGVLDNLDRTLGDVDVVLLSVGVFEEPPATGHADRLEATAATVVREGVGPIVAAEAVAQRLAWQGHGVLVVMSSAAALHPRPSRLAYAAAKAALDAYARGLAHRLRGSGAQVLIVRPGQLRAGSNAGRSTRFLTTTPRAIAAAVRRGVDEQRSVVYVPAALGPTLTLLKIVPRTMFDWIGGLGPPRW